MKHYIYSLFTFLFFFNCTENKSEVKQLTTLELSETSEFKDASEDKKQLFYEIKVPPYKTKVRK